MRAEASLPMFPCPMIFLFALSPKVTLSYLSPCKENKLRFISDHVSWTFTIQEPHVILWAFIKFIYCHEPHVTQLLHFFLLQRSLLHYYSKWPPLPSSFPFWLYSYRDDNHIESALVSCTWSTPSPFSFFFFLCHHLMKPLSCGSLF